MKRHLAALCTLLVCLPLFAQFKGTVRVDTNQSGILDKGDTPLAGVRVTDGRNVTVTDRQGRFSLPGYEKTRFITVTTPAGYEIRQFYQRTEKSRKTYDFLLHESTRTLSAEHSFVQITDTEVTGGVGRWATDLKQYIYNEKPAFLIHTGDICYESGLKMHKLAVNSRSMGCPVYYCIGNHDLVKGQYGEELYESIYGPTWYSFDVGNIHYVVTPINHGDNPTDYTLTDVYHWLKNDLAQLKPGQATVFFNHDLFTADDPFVFKADDEHILDLRPFHVKAQIYGHMHYNYVRRQGDVYTISTSSLDKGGIDHSTSAFRDIKVDKDNNLSTELRYTFIEPQASIVSPLNGQKAATDADGQILLSANAYHSQARTKEVTYALILSATGETIATGTLLPATDWNWATRISLPARCEGKELQLTVTSRFNDGQTATDTGRFRYEKDFKPSIASGEDWNTLLQNAAHTGGINASDIRLPLQQAWTANAGSNIFMTSPLIADEKVFVATTDDNISLHTYIYAFHLGSGKLLWKFCTENSVKNTIVYEDGVVVAQDASCHLYAIKAATGELLWKRLIDLDGYPYLTEGLTAKDGTVYAGIGAGLSAYDLNTGSVLWTNKDWRQREGSTTTLTVAGNVLVSGTQWGGLYGNDLKTGKQLWRLFDDGLGNRGASPVYKDGMLWIISAKGLFSIEPETGKAVKLKELNANLDVTSTPLITDNEIIFGTANRGITALDKSTLFTKWNAETKPSLVYTAPYSTTPQAGVETSPVASSSTVYIGASDGYLYAIDSATGILKDRIRFGAPIFSSVAVSGSCMVVCDYAGNVYCFTSSICN